VEMLEATGDDLQR